MSSNQSLSKAMSNVIVRDLVMDQISPRDAQNFEEGSSIPFYTEEKNRYTSLFKMIIPDRKWLQTKLQDGYKFTIVSGDMQQLNNMSVYSDKEAASMTSISLALFVTKNGEMVSCTEEFMPKSAFMSGSQYATVATDRIDRELLPEARILTMSGKMVTVTIMMIHEDWSTAIPTHLSSIFFERMARVEPMDDGKATITSAYVHLDMQQNESMYDLINKDGNACTFEDVVRGLFTIYGTVRVYLGFNIHRHNVVYRIYK
jgi:hypothetical protein